MRLQVAVQLGVASLPRLLMADGFSVSLSTERTISAHSASSCGVALQLSPRGLTLKLRLQRHGQKLQLPLYLATVCTAPLFGRRLTQQRRLGGVAPRLPTRPPGTHSLGTGLL